ncbi:MAG TPA: BON domain-containing protein [Gemmatimonadales bacterium]|jgi:osmotically-inducible protein OsmY|nr:BON domain-containing protein [Gemmatimonadales bacterium]
MSARNEFEPGPDEPIWEEIHDRLMGHPDLEVTEVEIEVEEGRVTLVGRVGSRESKWLAEELTRAVPGVQDVRNRLKVARW